MQVQTLNSGVNDVSHAIAIDNAWKRQFPSSGTLAGSRVTKPPKNTFIYFLYKTYQQ